MNGTCFLSHDQRREWFWRRVGRMGALLLLGIALNWLAFGAMAQVANAASGGLCTAAKRGVALALPAVVRITTTYQAQLIYRTADGTGVTFPQGGGTYTLSVSGAGAFISGNGDVLTAYSVVNVAQSTLTRLLAERAAPDIARALNDSSTNQDITADEILNQLLTDASIWQPSIQSPQTALYLSSQYSGPIEADSPESLPSYPVTVIAQSGSDQRPFNDLAILHVDGLRDMPMIPLGDSNQVYQGDTLTIIGYPESADLPSLFGPGNPTNFITASVKTVTVSAFKTALDEAQLIQIDRNMEPGDGGGPALNADGQLVGVVRVITGAESGSGQGNFLHPVNDAKPLAQEAKVNLAQDVFEKRWAAAYDACISSAPGHWHDAYNQYTQLARDYPNFRGVLPYIAYTKAQAAREPVPGSLPGWAIALIVALALAAAVGLFVLFRQHSLRKRVVYAGYGPGLNKDAPAGEYSFGLPPPSGQPPASPVTSEQIGVTIPAGGDVSPTLPDAASPTLLDQPQG